MMEIFLLEKKYDRVETALKQNAKELVKLSDLSLTNDIVLPGRFSRTYVDEENGVQFLGGKDIFQLTPKTEKFLSKVVHKKQIQGDLKISKNDISSEEIESHSRFIIKNKFNSVN